MLSTSKFTSLVFYFITFLTLKIIFVLRLIEAIVLLHNSYALRRVF